MKGVDQFPPALGAGNSPNLFACRLVEDHHEGLRRVVVDDVEAIVMEGGRGGHPESLRGIERANFLGPDDLSAHRESADESDAAKIYVDALAIGDRCFRCKAVLEVFFDRGRCAVQLALPDNFSRIEVDGVDHPSMLCQGSTRAVVVARVVKPPDGRLLFARADGRSDEDVVVPHDGELQLRPGMSISQATFSVRLHVSGKDGSSGTAPASGPRKRVQRASSSAEEPAAESTETIATMATVAIHSSS